MMLELIGKFHPLIVHLPIGIFCLAIIFKTMAYLNKNKSLEDILPITIFIGFAFSLLSLGTGYIHANMESIDSSLSAKHQFSAWMLTLWSFILFLLLKKSANLYFVHISWFMLLIQVILTGDYGGRLTHGINYFELSKEIHYTRPEIRNPDSAMVYRDIIEPILAAKCWSCHSAKKQRGGLRLDGKDWILQGGKKGKVLIPHDTVHSEISRRISLSEAEDDHMPPNGKPGLNKNEMQILKWWIAGGADFEKSMIESKPDAQMQLTIKNYLNSLESESQSITINPYIPLIKVSALDDGLLQAFNSKSISLQRIAQNSDWLYLVIHNNEYDPELVKIVKMKDHIAWINASHSKMNDKLIDFFTSCSQVTKLDLSHSVLTDAMLSKLSSLSNLKSLNLSNTPIHTIDFLNKMHSLQHVYLYNSSVPQEIIRTINVPGLSIDTGHYVVPLLKGDTSEIKRKELEEFNKEN